MSGSQWFDISHVYIWAEVEVVPMARDLLPRHDCIPSMYGYITYAT